MLKIKGSQPYYYFVGEYVTRVKECVSQCLLVVPSQSDIDIKKLNKDIASLRSVMV